MKDRKQMSAKYAGKIQPRILSTLYDFAGCAEFSIVFIWVKLTLSEKCLYLKRISTCYTANTT
jgi:hypothetical protein